MRPLLAVGLVVALATCRPAGSIVSPGAQLATGTWGGDKAGAIVNDTIAHIHVGCTYGDIPGRVKLDAEGRFTVDGTYLLRAFPVVLGPWLPAQFSGHVVGNTLTIAVAVNDTTSGKVVSLGPVTVRLGDEPKLGPCPICVMPGARTRVAAPLAPK